MPSSLHTYQIHARNQAEKVTMEQFMAYAKSQGMTFKGALFRLMEGAVDGNFEEVTYMCCECLAETPYSCPTCGESVCMHCIGDGHICKDGA